MQALKTRITKGIEMNDCEKNEYVYLPRDVVLQDWYSCQYTFSLFVHLLLIANDKKTKFQDIELEPGSVVTTKRILLERSGVPEKNLKISLENLSATGHISVKRKLNFLIILIRNWEHYTEEYVNHVSAGGLR